MSGAADLAVDILERSPLWRERVAGLDALCTETARAALLGGVPLLNPPPQAGEGSCELSIVLGDDELLRALNARLGTMSRHVPTDKSRAERLYYRTVGGILTPYCVSAPVLFDTQSVRRATLNGRLHCPTLDEARLHTLIEYALKHNFGLPRRASAARRSAAA